MLPKEPLELYQEPSRRDDIYVGDQPSYVTIFADDDNIQIWADLIM